MIPLVALPVDLLKSVRFILAKKRTFVWNIARGRLINTQALINSLEKGQIRGAILDDTDPEPLPKGHLLWKAPSLFNSPHVSWKSDKFFVRVLEILDINLERLSEGKQPINAVKREFTHEPISEDLKL